MDRTRGKVFGVAVAIAATGLLAACGGNDSTASSTPTLTRTTAVTQPPATSAPGNTGAPVPAPDVPQQPSVAPERPQPAPTNTVPTDKLDDKDKKFLDALKAQGLTPSSPEIAKDVAGYVCQSLASGAKEEEITPYVNAMAGSDPSFDPAKMPVEKAGKIYIDAAKTTYCQ